MISHTELDRLKRLKKFSVVQFQFSKMSPSEAEKALRYLLKFLKSYDEKLLRILGSKPDVVTFAKTFEIELLDDVEADLDVRKLQSFLVTFFTDDGVSNVKILDAK